MEPIIFLASPQEYCLTFYWPDVPGYYTGYRFSEGDPRLLGFPPGDYTSLPQSLAAPLRLDHDLPPRELAQNNPLYRQWMISHETETLAFKAYADGSAACWYEIGDWGLCEQCFRPEAHGIRMSLSLTAQRPIPGGLALQQCLRFTGRMNEPWRVQIAHFPLLSELDMQAMGRPNATLTYARRGGDWFNFPVQQSAYPTGPGLAYLPGEAPLDHGLILRESPARRDAPDSYWNRAAAGVPWSQISAGMYWDRTAWVSNRHPADCLHAWVDLGPLEPGETRSAQGKFYLIEGSKDELLAAWAQDFG